MASNLLQGVTQSCGCRQREGVADRNRTHDMSHTPEYNTWHSMKARCLNPRHEAYPNYGGRGIAICDRWLKSFAAFYADMGPRPEDSTLDRIDNDRGYEPDNCRWATLVEQHSNTRKNRGITFDGKTMTIAQWERRLGMTRDQLGQRLRDGWSIERAMTTAVKPRSH